MVFVARERANIKTLSDLVTTAKADPGSLTIATPGNGSTSYLELELIQHTAGLSLRHIPYNGGS